MPLAARLRPDHHADDVADMAALPAPVALAADRAEQALAAPGAEHELAALASVEAEAMQVVGRLLRPLLGRVGSEGFGMRRQHLVAQRLVGRQVGGREQADRDRVFRHRRFRPAQPPM